MTVVVVVLSSLDCDTPKSSVTVPKYVLANTSPDAETNSAKAVAAAAVATAPNPPSFLTDPRAPFPVFLAGGNFVAMETLCNRLSILGYEKVLRRSAKPPLARYAVSLRTRLSRISRGGLEVDWLEKWWRNRFRDFVITILVLRACVFVPFTPGGSLTFR